MEQLQKPKTVENGENGRKVYKHRVQTRNMPEHKERARLTSTITER